MPPYISLVIPAYNEAARLPRTLDELGKFLRGFEQPGKCVEVWIMVEGSADETLEIASRYAAQQAETRHRVHAVDNGPQRGKGHAVRSGMLRAQGEFVFYMDADLSVPLEEISRFLAYFEAHPEAEILVGNRQHPESRIERPQAWLRRSMGQTFNSLLGALALTGIRDTQCGFKAFRQRVVGPVFQAQEIDGFAFDVEVLAIAARLGCRIQDRPVVWINSPESKVHILRDSARMLRDAWRIRGRIAALPPADLLPPRDAAADGSPAQNG